MPGNIAQIPNNPNNSVRGSRDPHFSRLEAKLKRELGEPILQALDSEATEDIVLNPDSSLWIKRMGAGFQQLGTMPAAQAASAMNTIAAWMKRPHE